MATYLTRRVTFTASHRYWRADWSEAQNRRTFGSWATPDFHGHAYFCDVTVTGEVDSVGGVIIDLGTLDAALRREVHDRFDRKRINIDLAEFQDGMLVPSTENLAAFISEKMQSALVGTSARVTDVRLAEDETLSVTVHIES
jgi:6-pyruvoyltetrahydropterin/6-carboxytetrahydropterin synthase